MGGGGGVIGGMDHLDAAGFAASAGVDLGFDYGAAAELLGGGAGFGGGGRHPALRHGYAVTGEYLFGLIFVQLHFFSWPGGPARAVGCFPFAI